MQFYNLNEPNWFAIFMFCKAAFNLFEIKYIHRVGVPVGTQRLTSTVKFIPASEPYFTSNTDSSEIYR